MQRLIFLCVFLIAVLFTSCRPDPPDPPKNKAPVAKAGNDVMLIYPADSIVLDGSSSYDSDGKITTYFWTQLSNPTLNQLTNQDQSVTKAIKMLPGVHLFELKVTDNGGLFSKDTISITVQGRSRIRANAGPDQALIMPVNSTILDGSASVDSSGADLSFYWRQLSGNNSNITNMNREKTSISFSQVGTYRFELKVWNGSGAAFDTMTVEVKDMADCNPIRREVPGKLNFLHQLPITAPNSTPKMLTVGNRLYILYEADIYVYDVSAGTLSKKELGITRSSIGAVTAGSKIFFTDGLIHHDYDNGQNPIVSDVVGIYDATTDKWSTAKLSQARAFTKAASIGNKVVFAGGLASNVLSGRVDIYDLQTNQWTTSELAGEPRVIERVVTHQDNIYFIGGYTKWEDLIGWGFELTTATRTIDVYNVTSGRWSIENMQVNRHSFLAASVDDKIIIAGGLAGAYPYERLTSQVEIIKLPGMERSTSCLATPGEWYGNEAVALKDGSVIFFMNTDREKRKFNIYNPRTGEWTLGVLDEDVQGNWPELASINNKVYVLIGNKLSRLDY
ncbi:hypothetical protein HRH25_05810 [Flavisolibacter sp. BT320]|nr:hypothetical protein [Flavisolibacter longurius]